MFVVNTCTSNLEVTGSSRSEIQQQRRPAGLLLSAVVCSRYRSAAADAVLQFSNIPSAIVPSRQESDSHRLMQRNATVLSHRRLWSYDQICLLLLLLLLPESVNWRYGKRRRLLLFERVEHGLGLCGECLENVVRRVHAHRRVVLLRHEHLHSTGRRVLAVHLLYGGRARRRQTLHARRRLYATNSVVDAGTSELSMGPFCVTRSTPTHQMTDPTRSNPIQLTMELTVS